MTAPLIFDCNSFEVTVQDPSSCQSWIHGLKAVIDDLADDQPVTQFERYEDISASTHKDLGEVVMRAIIRYRAGAEGDNPFSDYLAWACSDKWGDESLDRLLDNYRRKPVDDLYSDIEDVMADYDGPVADIDELIEQMHVAVEEKIQENDTSSAVDLFSGHSVRLTFNPSYEPDKSSVDDIMFRANELRNYLSGHECSSFVNFLRLDKRTVLSMLEIDFKETDEIRKIIGFLKGLKHDLPPVLDSESVASLLESGGGYYVYPHWYGEIPFDDLLKLDPKNPIRLKGGVVALLDVVNGAGDFAELAHDAVLVMNPNQLPSPETWRYGIHEIHGGSSVYEAEMIEFDHEAYLLETKAVAERKNLDDTGPSLG